MTIPALAIEPVCSLTELITEEFSEHRLAKTLGHDQRVPRHLWDEALVTPLRDFLSRPGKEFRARLVRLGWQLTGRGGEPPPELPLIIEALHSGSLIVDDIEDGSLERRGAPALHQLYGVPLALNAGNFLYFWALELLTRLELPPITELSLQRAFSRTLLACHQGQALDLVVKIPRLEQSEVAPTVSAVTHLKTGKLCELAAHMGALAAGASLAKAQAIASFGRELGVGLQMLDDLSGIANPERADKGAEDLRSGRPTWPWAWAAAALDARAYQTLQSHGVAVLTGEDAGDALAERLTRMVGKVGRAEVHSRLESALAQLRQAGLEPRALAELEHELARLEKSYG